MKQKISQEELIRLLAKIFKKGSQAVHPQLKVEKITFKKNL